MRRTVVVGNGIGGITAARFLRKAADDSIVVVSAESRFHFARTALMYAYMGDLNREDLKPYEDNFWKKNDIELRQEYAQRIDRDRKEVVFATGERIGYDRLVLATGSRPARFGWPGQHLNRVQGLYSLQDLDSMEEATSDVRSAVVVGGGLIGIELAEMLRSRRIHVTFLVREHAYMDYLFGAEESELIHREIEAHGVDLRLGTELDRIVDDGSGGAQSVITAAGDEIPARFVGLATGVKPRIELAAASGIETDRGILVERDFSTSEPNVYAAGDCAQFRNPLSHGGDVEQLWYSARRQGKTLGRILGGEPLSYDEPVFYNSAKFFDLEYQTYGRVPSVPTGDIDIFFWQSPARDRSVRIAFDAHGRVRGVSALGVRMRHDRWSAAISEGISMSDVARDLDAYLFNPEFDSSVGKAIRVALSRQFPAAA